MMTKKLNTLFPLFLFATTVIYSQVARQVYVGRGTPKVGEIKYDAKSRDGRLRYAEDLLSFITKIDNQIPSLSPSQKEWLEKEMTKCEKTKDSKRYSKLFNTKEYHIDVAKSGLAEISDCLNKIILNLKIAEPSLKDEKEEIYRWSVIVDSLMDNDFWNDLFFFITEFRVVDTKLFELNYTKNIEPLDIYTFYVDNGIQPARQILTNIIALHLNQWRQ